LCGRFNYFVLRFRVRIVLARAGYACMHESQRLCYSLDAFAHKVELFSSMHLHTMSWSQICKKVFYLLSFFPFFYFFFFSHTALVICLVFFMCAPHQANSAPLLTQCLSCAMTKTFIWTSLDFLLCSFCRECSTSWNCKDTFSQPLHLKPSNDPSV